MVQLSFVCVIGGEWSRESSRAGGMSYKIAFAPQGVIQCENVNRTADDTWEKSVGESLIIVFIYMFWLEGDQQYRRKNDDKHTVKEYVCKEIVTNSSSCLPWQIYLK